MERRVGGGENEDVEESQGEKEGESMKENWKRRQDVKGNERTAISRSSDHKEPQDGRSVSKNLAGSHQLP